MERRFVTSPIESANLSGMGRGCICVGAFDLATVGSDVHPTAAKNFHRFCSFARFLIGQDRINTGDFAGALDFPLGFAGKSKNPAWILAISFFCFREENRNARIARVHAVFLLFCSFQNAFRGTGPPLSQQIACTLFPSRVKIEPTGRIRVAARKTIGWDHGRARGAA